MRGVMGGIMGGILEGCFLEAWGLEVIWGPEGGSGIGMFEILLIGALLFGVYWYIKRRDRLPLPMPIIRVQ